MNGPADLAKGWLRKADSDIGTARVVLAGDGPFDTAYLDVDQLAEITPYAVELRYDPGFWPDRATAQDAVDAASRVRGAIAEALPEQARP